MTWFKTDDHFHEHPKVVGISFAAEGLWHRAGCWCSAQLTDGRVPARLLKAWHAPAELADELVELGLWLVETDGWRFHDFLDYQPSREQVLAKRSDERLRKSSAKAPKPFRDSSARNTNGIHPPSEHVPAPPVPVPVPVPEKEKESSSSNARAIELVPRGAEHDGYRWLSEVLGGVPPDLGSWRAEYARIGARPETERVIVAQSIRATKWLMEKRSRCTPGHIVKHWESLRDGPRNFEASTLAPLAKRGIAPVSSAEEFALDRAGGNDPW